MNLVPAAVGRNIKNAAVHKDTMITIKEAIIVEGIYDKMKLEQFIHGVIIPIHGFSLLNDKQHMELIRQMAKKRGIIILTDSDRAGFLIRRKIQSCIPSEQIKHAYIPEIQGKEKRKRSPGKEGLKGVEGVPKEIIIHALKTAGCIMEDLKEEQTVTKDSGQPITKLDLFRDGLSGGKDSKKFRIALLKELNLPSRLTSNTLLDVLNTLFTYEQYKEVLTSFQDSNQVEE